MNKIKKILFSFVILILVLGVLGACSGESKTWDEIKEDVNLLVENGFVIIDDDTQESVDSANRSFQIQFYEYNLDFLITNIYVLCDSESGLDTIGFCKFDDKNDAEKIYKILLDERQEGSTVKSWLFGDIFVSSNSERATELLNY